MFIHRPVILGVWQTSRLIIVFHFS